MGSDASCTISDEYQGENETPIIRAPNASIFAAERMMSRFPDLPSIGTIYDLFEHTKSICPDDPYYGYRVYKNGAWMDHWETVSRAQFSEMRDSVGAFLIRNGMKFEDRVGILSYNRLEWVLVQHACFAYGFTPVPVYDTFGWENINYILKHAEVKIVFVISTKVDDLARVLSDTLVSHVVVFDAEEHPCDMSKVPRIEGVQFHNFRDVLVVSDRFPRRPPTPDTVASIMYTSGTTGHPKGCVLTHSNFIATAACFESFVYPFGPTDRLLSYLPLAHVYEAVIHVVATKVIGAVISFYSGSISRLVDEVRLVKPTIFIGVGRVYERISDGIKAKIAKKPAIIRNIFGAAFHIKSFLTSRFGIQHVPLLDKVFGSVREALGSDLRLMICGGSSLSEEIQNFMRIACNVSFIQGYGMTETTAGTAVQKYTDTKNGRLGVLLQCAEAKLRDLPEQGYYAKDWCGELYVRGPSVFKGYYKNPEETEKVFDNGWLKTGDVFRLLPTGQFTIISRCKDLVKLSQGEYVSLSKLQILYTSVQYVSQIYIHAGMASRYLVAIVVLDQHTPGWNEITKQKMLEMLNQKATEAHLNGFERIKAVHLITEEFSAANGTMTPSLKLCNFKIMKKYERELEALEKEACS